MHRVKSGWSLPRSILFFPLSLRQETMILLTKSPQKYIRRLSASFRLLLLFVFLCHYCCANEQTLSIFPIKWRGIILMQLQEKVLDWMVFWFVLHSSHSKNCSPLSLLPCYRVVKKNLINLPSLQWEMAAALSIQTLLSEHWQPSSQDCCALDVDVMHSRVGLTWCWRFGAAQADRLFWSPRATTVVLSRGVWAAVGLASAVTRGDSHFQRRARPWRCLWSEVTSLGLAGCRSGRVRTGTLVYFALIRRSHYGLIDVR